MAAGTGSECGAHRERRRRRSGGGGGAGAGRGQGNGNVLRRIEQCRREGAGPSVARGGDGANGPGEGWGYGWCGRGEGRGQLKGAGPVEGGGAPGAVSAGRWCGGPLHSLPSPGRAQAAERRPHGALVHPREALPGLIRHAEWGPELVRHRGEARALSYGSAELVWRCLAFGSVQAPDARGPGAKHGLFAVPVCGFSPCQFVGQQLVINSSAFGVLSVQNKIGLSEMEILDMYLDNLFASFVTYYMKTEVCLSEQRVLLFQHKLEEVSWTQGGYLITRLLCIVSALITLFCCLFPLTTVKFLWKCNGVIRS